MFWWICGVDEKYVVFAWLSFFSFNELFPAGICASNSRSLIINLFGVKILIPVPVFWLSNFSLSATVSFGGTNSSLVFTFSRLF